MKGRIIVFVRHRASWHLDVVKMTFHLSIRRSKIEREGLLNTSYDRYKYFFRVNPINSTALGGEIIAFFTYLRGYMEARLLQGFG
jgi:hypothetical protein